MKNPTAFEMLQPIYSADHGAYVIVREWSFNSPCLFSGQMSEMPADLLDGFVVQSIEARIEEDMKEIQYYSVTVTQLG